MNNMISACMLFTVMATATQAAPIYLAFENHEGHQLVALDDGGGVTHLLVDSTPLMDIAVDERGNLLLGRRDGSVVLLDVESLSQSTLVSGFERIESIAAVDGTTHVCDGWRGVFRITESGVEPVYEDPDPAAHRYRYEGLTSTGDAVAWTRRPFACFSEPQVLMTLGEGSVAPSVLELPFHSLDMDLAGNRLVLTDWTCAGTENLHVMDADAAAITTWDVSVIGGTTLKLGVDEEGWVVRGSTGLVSSEHVLAIDRVHPGSGAHEVLLLLRGRLEALAVDSRDALARLGCDDDHPRNHGDHVSCVAHVTKDLVRAGRMTDAERSRLIVAAAQSDAGKQDAP